MKTPSIRLLALPLLFLQLNPAPAGVDLFVADFSFEPGNVETLVYPDRVYFTLGNFGPLANCDVQMEFILSRNTTAGDADDQPLASFIHSACLSPFEGVYETLPTSERAQLTVPADASGEYQVLLRVTPAGDTDPDMSDNVTVATNRLTLPPPASIYSVFANSSLVTSNMSISPGANFAYNAYYGNCWRIFQPDGGFSGTFTAPQAGAYTLRVRHGTSFSQSCPNNGYAPMNIYINGTNLVADYDVAANHASYWFENETWTIQANEGENTLEWVAGNLCTHYWIQRIELKAVPMQPRIDSIIRMGAGQIQLMITGQAGRTNVVEVSADLSNWLAVTNIFNETGGLSWLAAAPPVGSNRFYRLRQLEP
ncbi:MAG: hypothetical protein IT579_07830 [Verrucomicrobia subdivision 3 bacterium]|nr:hypothetical protein [Verrucomicrobiota bacterium]MCC6820621.1 hypothetical protein [Limisphaerales bacterium]